MTEIIALNADKIRYSVALDMEDHRDGRILDIVCADDEDGAINHLIEEYLGNKRELRFSLAHAKIFGEGWYILDPTMGMADIRHVREYNRVKLEGRAYLCVVNQETGMVEWFS